MSEQDPILDKARQLRQAGASIEEVKQYLASKGYETGEAGAPAPISSPPLTKPHDYHAEYASGALDKRMKGANKRDAQNLADEEGEPQAGFRGLLKSAYEKADAGAGAMLATEANLVRGIKPLAMAQTGLRALFRRQPYSEAKSDIEGFTSKLPGPTKELGQQLGALPANLMMPGSSVRQMVTSAAGMGAGSMMTDDPKVGTGEAVARMAGGAAGGAAVSGVVGGTIRAGEKIGKLTGLANRIRKADPLDVASGAKKDIISADDAVLYGAAEREAQQGGGTSPKIQALFKDPKFGPLADDIRETHQFVGRPDDDASILLQMHKELTQKQGPLYEKVIGGPAHAPLTERQSAVLGRMKEMIREAGEELMPSFPPAVAQHAEGMGEKRTMLEAGKRSRDLMSNKKASIKNIDRDSEEGSMRWARSRTPDQAKEALPGALGAGKEAYQGFRMAPWALGGGASGMVYGNPVAGAATGIAAGFGNAAGRAAMRGNRLAPFIEALDQSAGNKAKLPLDLETIMKMLGVANTAGAGSP